MKGMSDGLALPWLDWNISSGYGSRSSGLVVDRGLSDSCWPFLMSSRGCSS
jgi:hypothetical protein